jgi:CheY-like chemotaxis protein
MRTVLVVDDSQIELMMGKALLSRLGYAVVTASTGEEAAHYSETLLSLSVMLTCRA